MSWWGKAAGGVLGYALGDTVGALIGVFLGHLLDRSSSGSPVTGFDMGSQKRTQAVFFSATFSVMGHISKADGRVTKEEIKAAEQVMAQMQLTADQRRKAIEYFNQGKQADFDLNDVLQQFRKECRRKMILMQVFVEIQLQAIYADGNKHPSEDNLIRHICTVIGFPNMLLTQLESLIIAQQRSYQASGSRNTYNEKIYASELDNAYKILGVDKTSNDSEVKKAYRRLMSQHHPDKLISKGMPEEMIEIATNKTQEIQKAYELIKESRE